MLLLSFEQSKRLIAKIRRKVHKRMGGLTVKRTEKNGEKYKNTNTPHDIFRIFGCDKAEISPHVTQVKIIHQNACIPLCDLS